MLATAEAVTVLEHPFNPLETVFGGPASALMEPVCFLRQILGILQPQNHASRLKGDKTALRYRIKEH